MQRFLIISLLIGNLLLINGCGSSSSGSRLGTFMDSAVEGLTYTTDTLSGETDSLGRFHFNTGETITFSIGGVVLGSATAKDVITPVDLVIGAQDESNPAVTNIVRLLITLDEDNNPDNGITISPVLSAALDLISVTFNQDPSVFSQDSNVLDVINLVSTICNPSESQERALCSIEEAQAHFANTLEQLAKNGYTSSSGHYGGGGSSGGGGCG